MFGVNTAYMHIVGQPHITKTQNFDCSNLKYFQILQRFLQPRSYFFASIRGSCDKNKNISQAD